MINILSESMPTNYNTTEEFKKNFKKLSRKYRTLFADLENFKRRMFEVDIEVNKNFAILIRKGNIKIIKARLFCRSLKRNSLRIIYAEHTDSQKINFISIEFIELYFKGDKENEDRERIKKYLKST